MKRIKSFPEEKKTLKRFLVNIAFKNQIKSIEFEEIATLIENVSDIYPKKPSLMLLPTNIQAVNIEIGPLTFFDEKKINNFQLGQNFLNFNFLKYDTWDFEIKKIIQVYSALKDTIEIPAIDKIVLTYTDEFIFERDGFRFNNFFTIPQFPEEDGDWKINYDDFTFGFIPRKFIDDLTNIGKTVVRIRGRLGKNRKLVYQMDTVDSYEIVGEQKIDFEEILNNLHDRIIHYFIISLNEDFRDDIQLIIEDD